MEINEETIKSSMKHILNNIKCIERHLIGSKKENYDWRQDIRNSLEEIETESKCWFDKSI